MWGASHRGDPRTDQVVALIEDGEGDPKGDDVSGTQHESSEEPRKVVPVRGGQRG